MHRSAPHTPSPTRALASAQSAANSSSSIDFNARLTMSPEMGSRMPSRNQFPSKPHDRWTRRARCGPRPCPRHRRDRRVGSSSAAPAGSGGGDSALAWPTSISSSRAKHVRGGVAKGLGQVADLGLADVARQPRRLRGRHRPQATTQPDPAPGRATAAARTWPPPRRPRNGPRRRPTSRRRRRRPWPGSPPPAAGPPPGARPRCSRRRPASTDRPRTSASIAVDNPRTTSIGTAPSNDEGMTKGEVPLPYTNICSYCKGNTKISPAAATTTRTTRALEHLGPEENPFGCPHPGMPIYG